MTDLKKHSSLGKNVTYHSDSPNTALLVAIPRAQKRHDMNIPTEPLPFGGFDIWNAYEFSWLRPNGRPDVGILTVHVPASSPCLIESKSFKLYLNSFNQSKIDTLSLKQKLIDDLSQCAQTSVKVQLRHPRDYDGHHLMTPCGVNLDELDPTGPYTYQPEPSLLQTIKPTEYVEETLVSSLLKSNCLITHQPDWADIQVYYQGAKINHQQLLRYFISFRMKNEFHEPCVEKIYMDILRTCQPTRLRVTAQYTRRGGLDINPSRANFLYEDKAFIRTPRQ
ncbi:MAG: NADPH-dependent 7-cyano-7-deazaguanine reductase QueF [Oligoflexales bacterium]